MADRDALDVSAEDLALLGTALMVFIESDESDGGTRRRARILANRILAVIDAREEEVTPTSPSRATRQDLLQAVRDVVADARGDMRFGAAKVFIGPVWDQVGPRSGMTKAQFDKWLLGQLRLGTLVLARADLVAAMDPTLVASSEVRADGATFHFILDPNGYNR